MAKVLIVDDDAELLEYAAVCLASEHDVETALNAHEALVLFKKTPYDVLITDILMPDMDGLEFIREIRGLATDLPVIAISAGMNLMPFDTLKAAEGMGANATLQKPFTADQLLDLVRATVSGD